MKENLFYIVIGLSLVLNIFFGSEYYQKITQASLSEVEKVNSAESVVKKQNLSTQEGPIRIENGYITRVGVVRKHEGSTISGALLIPGFSGARLVDVDGRILQVWKLNDDFWISGVKLLKDGSLAYINKKELVVRVVDKESKVLWELQGDPKVDHFHPYLWAFDQNNEMYFVKDSKDGGCPYIVRVNRDKKMTWWTDVPKGYCNVDLNAIGERNVLGVFRLDYIQQFGLTGKPALGIATGTYAFVMDIESKKVIWEYKREDNKSVIMALKFQRNGKNGRLMSDNGSFVRLLGVDFSQKEAANKWVNLMITDPKTDFFNLGQEHVLITDGGVRFFELNVPLDGQFDRQSPILWSLFVTAEGLVSNTIGSDYIENH